MSNTLSGKKAITTVMMNPIQNKTKRSHSENKERAYIAASRRTDRSIEARVQSAQMASKIHKRRTGRALRVSEAIVMRQEMYEEEERFPRSYRLLDPCAQTSSTMMNWRAKACLANQVPVSKLVSDLDKKWRENDVNQVFAETFPCINQNLSQAWLPSGLPNPVPHQNARPFLSHAPSFKQSCSSAYHGEALESNIWGHNISKTSPPMPDTFTDDQSPPSSIMTPESESHFEASISQSEPSLENFPSTSPFVNSPSQGSDFMTEPLLETTVLDLGVKSDMLDPLLYLQP